MIELRPYEENQFKTIAEHAGIKNWSPDQVALYKELRNDPSLEYAALSDHLLFDKCLTPKQSLLFRRGHPETDFNPKSPKRV